MTCNEWVSIEQKLCYLDVIHVVVYGKIKEKS